MPYGELPTGMVAITSIGAPVNRPHRTLRVQVSHVHTVRNRVDGYALWFTI